MHTQLRSLLFAAVFAVGASVFLGSAAPARGEEQLRYSSGALAVGGNSSRRGYSGSPRGWANDQAPATVPGYRLVHPQPAYRVPAPNPAVGTWSYAPQPTYRVPGAVTGYWRHDPVR